MRNNSVTKRRRKIRTGRIKTHQPQSKRCKKISPQIGGIFTKNGWKCRCRVDGKVPEAVNYNGDYGEYDDEEEEHEEDGPRSQGSSRSTNILEGGQTLLFPNDNLRVTEQGQIKIHNSIIQRVLPKHLDKGDIITEIKADENSQVIKVENIGKIQDFMELIYLLNSNTVILTVSRKHKGGHGNNGLRYVRVKLGIPREPAGVNPVPRRMRENNVGGGKKTTYRRKKHVTRRKINTKRRKVMVGGTIPDSTEWNSLGLDGKFKAIESVSSIEELQTIWGYIASLKETTPNVEFQQLSNKVAVRKQVLNDDEGEDDSAKLNLKKTVICKCSKTERNKVNKVNKGNDKRKETPEGEVQTVGKGEML